MSKNVKILAGLLVMAIALLAELAAEAASHNEIMTSRVALGEGSLLALMLAYVLTQVRTPAKAKQPYKRQ